MHDIDCDPGSYCTQQDRCAVLGFGGPVACAATAPSVSARCAASKDAASFLACVGDGGPSGCPYCLGSSCYEPGTCEGDNDCHAGAHCETGLCRTDASGCPSVVSIADVFHGVFSAGKQVCVTGRVEQVRSGYDGLIEIKLDQSPYLYVDVPPMYALSIPSVGQTITVHGTVRWDASHNDRELCPVDFIE
jgi:hypothetical protein